MQNGFECLCRLRSLYIAQQASQHHTSTSTSKYARDGLSNTYVNRTLKRPSLGQVCALAQVGTPCRCDVSQPICIRMLPAPDSPYRQRRRSAGALPLHYNSSTTHSAPNDPAMAKKARQRISYGEYLCPVRSVHRPGRGRRRRWYMSLALPTAAPHSVTTARLAETLRQTRQPSLRHREPPG